jgi:hypothetical protein
MASDDIKKYRKIVTENEQTTQEVIFYNSGYGEKIADGQKKKVSGMLKMDALKGPIFTMNDGLYAEWKNGVWVADLD